MNIASAIPTFISLKTRRYHIPHCRRSLLTALLIAACMSMVAQAPQLKFLHVSIEHGLPDGSIRSITQDKYGYMWLGTQYGLCRYNGYNITTFFHLKGDSASLAGNFIWSVFTDSDGDVWAGNDALFSKYNYHNNSFKNYRPPYNVVTRKIAQDEKGLLWLATSSGLMKFNKQTGVFGHYRDQPTQMSRDLSQQINDFFLDTTKGLIYLATQAGFRVFDYRHDKMMPLLVNGTDDPFAINSNSISVVTKDKNGDVWFGCGFINTALVRWQPASNNIKYYHDLTDKSRGWSENRALCLFTDRDGHVWAGGWTSSLSLYLPEKDAFHHYRNDALLGSSIAGNNIDCIYQDKSGMIWVGAEGYGVDRFQPQNSLFTSFQPQAAVQPSLLHDWGRAAIEDSRGNFWFGTSRGITVYDPSKGLYRNYFNDQNNPALISFNSIRSFAEDKKGNIWIGTGNGLTRYDPVTGKFRIFGPQDSLRSYFVWSLLETKKGVLYVGGTGGLQRYDPVTDKLIAATDDETVNRKMVYYNIRNIFEDTNGDLWIGSYDGGLFYYQPGKNIVTYYRHDEKDPTSICSDFVTSVVEDKKGIIWIATRDGLNSFDRKTKRFSFFTTADGLPSNKTSALRVDNANRLWIATGDGLSVLDDDRCIFRNFDMSDGLPTNEFNDQVAASTHDGKFIYPTFRGFMLFHPEEVQQKKYEDPALYISGFRVFDKPLVLATTPEETKELSLRYTQNFFSIELTALDYENPDKVMYAYKLDPFNKDWVYTKERNISYTNVPGGSYTFYYKATSDPTDWNVPVREIKIKVGTVFYKTGWFIVLAILLTAGLIYGFYTYRLRQTAKLHHLQLQATRLEKDKTEIQYQNLINQFNPHFLFNSLTSLNSLIYENKELASDFLEQLSAVYRYLLTHKETQLVELEAEQDFVKHYISLLKTRFEKGLQITINIPAHLAKKKIVPVTFQLLIENAIKHNIIDEASPLIISFTADDQYLQVTNNLQQKAYVETSNRKGLDSLQSLYKYLSSLPLVVEQSGKVFIIKVPLL
jgi:ligand-binding sensor domain-containing protein